MEVVVSAHFDIARPVMSIQIDKENLSGIVDNFAGVFTSYQASRKLGTKVYLTNYEELEYDGAESVAKTLEKDTLVIVVDTTTDAEEKDAYIGNVYGFTTEKLKEKFAEKILFKEGFYEEKEDETWIYGKKYGFKTFYFGVPIPHDYHDINNKISLSAIDKASQVLEDLIKWLHNNIDSAK